MVSPPCFLRASLGASEIGLEGALEEAQRTFDSLRGC